MPWCVAGFETGDLNSGRLGKELQVKQTPYDCSDLEPNSGTALILPLKSLWNHLKEGNKRQTPEKISYVIFCPPQLLPCGFTYQFNYFWFHFFFFHFYIGCSGNSYRLWMLPSASYLNKDSNNNTSNLWNMSLLTSSQSTCCTTTTWAAIDLKPESFGFQLCFCQRN